MFKIVPWLMILAVAFSGCVAQAAEEWSEVAWMLGQITSDPTYSVRTSQQKFEIYLVRKVDERVYGQGIFGDVYLAQETRWCEVQIFIYPATPISERQCLAYLQCRGDRIPRPVVHECPSESKSVSQE